MDIVTTAEAEDAVDSEDVAQAEEPIVTELLVEEVSIDGMCGVY